jgi:F420H(2)-dependent quinone reductase
MAAHRLQLIGTAVHRAILRLSRGRLTGRVGRAPVLLLTTTGRRSGRRRTIPLLYVADGDAYVVIASNGGAPSHPSWYHNLHGNPDDVTVEVRGTRTPVHADDVPPGPERDRLWQAATAIYKGYADYATRTDRAIPIVRLTPRP